MTTRDWKSLSVEISNYVAEVTLTGPGKGNAMGPDFWAEAADLFAQLDADPETWPASGSS